MIINFIIDESQDEEWRLVKGFNGMYAVSNKGRLASRKRKQWHILSNKNSKGDYFPIVLEYKGEKKHTRLHRLVYETFIGEIPNNMIIHHINGNKQDNNIDNLVLLTSKEHSQQHAFIENDGQLQYSDNIKALNRYNQYIRPRKIIQYDLDGEYIALYNNSKEASNATGVCQRNILQVASKEPYNKKGSIRKQAGGYIWKYEE